VFSHTTRSASLTGKYELLIGLDLGCARLFRSGTSWGSGRCIGDVINRARAISFVQLIKCNCYSQSQLTSFSGSGTVKFLPGVVFFQKQLQKNEGLFYSVTITPDYLASKKQKEVSPIFDDVHF
jgi:hypothetical protein